MPLHLVRLKTPTPFQSAPVHPVAAAVALLMAILWAQPNAFAQAAATEPMATETAVQEADATTTAPELPTTVVKVKRANRVSKGATNLPMEVKDTPQSISTIDKETLRDFGATDSNDALRYGTGLTVDEWETNRTSFSARGFDVMLTQIDGLGMTNEWGRGGPAGHLPVREDRS